MPPAAEFIFFIALELMPFMEAVCCLVEPNASHCIIGFKATLASDFALLEPPQPLTASAVIASNAPSAAHRCPLLVLFALLCIRFSPLLNVSSSSLLNPIRNGGCRPAGECARRAPRAEDRPTAPSVTCRRGSSASASSTNSGPALGSVAMPEVSVPRLWPRNQ